MFAVEQPAPGDAFSAAIRYRSAPKPCRYLGGEQGGHELLFDNPVEGAAPGQSVVLYDGDMVAGGGVIERARNAAAGGE